jgi:hypothetical protein
MTANITHDEGCTTRARGSQRSIRRYIRSHFTRPFLAASRQRLVPVAARFIAEPPDGPRVAGDAVVLAVATYLWDGKTCNRPLRAATRPILCAMQDPEDCDHPPPMTVDE